MITRSSMANIKTLSQERRTRHMLATTSYHEEHCFVVTRHGRRLLVMAGQGDDGMAYDITMRVRHLFTMLSMSRYNAAWSQAPASFAGSVARLNINGRLTYCRSYVIVGSHVQMSAGIWLEEQHTRMLRHVIATGLPQAVTPCRHHVDCYNIQHRDVVITLLAMKTSLVRHHKCRVYENINTTWRWNGCRWTIRRWDGEWHT